VTAAPTCPIGARHNDVMPPAKGRRPGESVKVTPRAERSLASHVERVRQAEVLAIRQRAAMYDAIGALVAAGEMTTDVAAAALEVSRPTLMRALAAHRAAKQQAADGSPPPGYE
jgi:predicted DNA-binding protein (UPF0251 family)